MNNLNPKLMLKPDPNPKLMLVRAESGSKLIKINSDPQHTVCSYLTHKNWGSVFEKYELGGGGVLKK
jgi:hypothetical protein